jgi:hypothetical protein
LRARALCSALAFALCAGQAWAAEPEVEEVVAPPTIQFGGRLGVTYSDNYLRSATDEVDSTTGIVGFEVGGRRTTGRLKYSMYGDVEYQQPFESSLEADLVGRMAATSDYEIVPELLGIYAAGLYTQVRPDLFRPESVNNREDVLSWAFGPETRLRLGNSMSALMDIRYTASDYSQRALDNQTLGGEVVVGHDGARENFIGVGAGYYDVTYKEHTEPGAVDHTREEAFGRLRASGARTTVSLDLGYGKVSADIGEDSGPLVRANLTRQLTPSILAYLNYTNEYPVSDSPTIVGQGTVVPDDESVLTAAPRRTKSGALGFSFMRPRTEVDLVYMHSVEEGVLDTEGERTWQELRGKFVRRFTAAAFGTLYAWRTQEDLRDLALVPVEATTTTFGGDFEMLFGRKLSLVIYAEYKNQESDLIIDRYKEFTGGLYVNYGRVDSTAAQGGATAPLGR